MIYARVCEINYWNWFSYFRISNWGFFGEDYKRGIEVKEEIIQSYNYVIIYRSNYQFDSWK